MSSGLGKTPWVDRALTIAWDRLEEVAPDGAMPLAADELARKFVAQEYGCGHYGCVMPTAEPGVVLKLSSDPTEAHLVAAALQLAGNRDDAWTGIVRYHAIYQIRNAFYRRRPIFAIWREEAHDVGFLLREASLQRLREAQRRNDPSVYDIKSLRELEDNLGHFKEAAGMVRDKLKRAKDPFAMLEETDRYAQWAWKAAGADAHPWKMRQVPAGAAGVAYLLALCQVLVQLMENTYDNDTIGTALGYFLENGLLLADVHINNVGRVTRDWGDYTGEQIVITDPGHAVPLDPRWSAVVIEEI